MIPRLRLGLLPTAPLTLEGSLGQVAQQLANAPVPGDAAAVRPDVQVLVLTGDRARAEALLAKAAAWENIRVGMALERETEANETGGTDKMGFVGLRVTVPLPLWNRNQGRVAEQLATASQAEAQVQALKLTIRSEIETAQERARLLKEVLGSYDQQVLPLLEQSVETLRSGYAEGQTNLADVVQNRVQQFSLQASQAEAQRNYALALVDLQIASAGSPFLKGSYLSRRTTDVKPRRNTSAK